MYVLKNRLSQRRTAVVEAEGAGRPSAFRLGAAYPNPFNPRTMIPFELPVSGDVDLAVYDLLGRRVRTLVKGTWSAGRHQVAWDGRTETGRSVSSGVYLYRLETGGQDLVRKMIQMK